MGEDEMAAGVITMLALAMAAPEGSVTWPRKVPVAAGVGAGAAWAGGVAAGIVGVCAAASVTHNCNDEAMSAVKRDFRTFIQYSVLLRVFARSWMQHSVSAEANANAMDRQRRRRVRPCSM